MCEQPRRGFEDHRRNALLKSVVSGRPLLRDRRGDSGGLGHERLRAEYLILLTIQRRLMYSRICFVMRRPKPKEESAIGVHDGAMSRRSPGAGETAGPQAGAAPGPVHDFALALERHGRGTAVLVLGGELDLYRAPEIEDALARAIRPLPGSDRCEPTSDRCEPTFDGRSGDGPQIPGEEVRRLAVDLRSVTFIDSTTLALLLAASRHQHAQGGELLVLVGPQTPMSAFEVTGLDRLLAIRRVEDDQGNSAA